MKRLAVLREDLCLAVLLAAAAITYALGDASRSGSTHVAAALAVLTLFKGVLVAREFMGLRGVSLRWQFGVLGWLLGVLGLIAVAWART